MNDKNRYYIYGILLILVILSAGLIWSQERGEDTDGIITDDEVMADDATEGANASLDEGVSFELLDPSDPGVEVPEIRRAITFKEDTPENVRVEITASFERVTNTLEENHLNIEAWQELGTLRKFIEDYEGASAAWKYALLLNPGSMITNLNLAGLYGYFIRDFSTAEKYYRLAIEHSPSSLQAYGQAYEFFDGVVRDKEKAVGIIDLGLTNNPNSTELKEFRAMITQE